MCGYKFLQQSAAFLAVEIDDFDAILAEPLDSPTESAALAYDDYSDAKLPHQPAAIPAGSERCDHHQIAIAALAAGAAKGIRLAVDTGIALLHTAIAATAHQLTRAREEGRADWNATLCKPQTRLVECHIQHAPIVL